MSSEESLGLTVSIIVDFVDDFFDNASREQNELSKRRVNQIDMIQWSRCNIKIV